MKTKIFVGLLGGLVILAAGCVDTVSGGKAGGIPLVRDTMDGRYPRSVDEVFNASKAVVAEMGVMNNEGILHSETNLTKYVEGRINERRVWVRVEAIEPKVTAVTVQTRTSGGGGDIYLAHQIEKNIALKLVH